MARKAARIQAGCHEPSIDNASDAGISEWSDPEISVREGSTPERPACRVQTAHPGIKRTYGARRQPSPAKDFTIRRSTVPVSRESRVT